LTVSRLDAIEDAVEGLSARVDEIADGS